MYMYIYIYIYISDSQWASACNVSLFNSYFLAISNKKPEKVIFLFSYSSFTGNWFISN